MAETNKNPRRKLTEEEKEQRRLKRLESKKKRLERLEEIRDIIDFYYSKTNSDPIEITTAALERIIEQPVAVAMVCRRKNKKEWGNYEI